MAATYGGYEVVRELSRSPLELRAVVRAPGGDERLLRVCFLDPIAQRGQERLIVESFLAQVAIEQRVRGECWLKVHDVGETDEGAFAVSELLPRTLRTLIDGRSRLEAGAVKAVLLGVVQGLIELRDSCSGRAHGTLRPEVVHVDDAGGQGSWRVALSEPGAEATSAEAAKQARVYDLRSIAGIAIGLVEHRIPRSLNKPIEVNESWKRVAGPDAAAWVREVNRLLEPELDPAALTLESVRDGFAALVVRRKKSPAKLIAVGVVGLVLLLGGGGYATYTLMSGSKSVQPSIEPDNLTQEVWEDWVRKWVALDQLVESEVDRRGWDPVLFKQMVDARDQAKREDLVFRASGGRRDANPRFGFNDPPTVQSMVQDPATYYQLLMSELGQQSEQDSKKVLNALESRAALIRQDIAPKIEQAVRQHATAGNLSQLLTTLDGLKVQAPWLADLRESQRSLSEFSFNDFDELSRALSLARHAEAVLNASQALTALDGIVTQKEERLASLRQSHAYEDAVIADVRGLVAAELQFVEVTGEIDVVVAEMAQRVSRLHKAAKDVQEHFVSSEFDALHLPTFAKVVSTTFAQGHENKVESLERWLKLAKSSDYRSLSPADDPLAPGEWRTRGSESALAAVNKTLRELEELPDIEEANRAEYDTVLPAFRAQRDTLSQDIAAALEVAPISSERDALAEQRRSIEARIAALDTSASEVLGRLGINAEKLLAQIDSSLLDRPLWALFDGIQRDTLVPAIKAEVARNAENPRELRRIQGLWASQVQLLDRMNEHFDVTLGVSRPSAEPLVIEGVERAINAERLNLAQAELARVRWNEAESISQSMERFAGVHPELAAAAEQARGAIDAALRALGALDRWRPIEEVNGLDALLGLQVVDQPTITSEIASMLEPLRARVEAARAQAGRAAADLYETVAATEGRPELRLAAYFAVSDAGVAGLERELEAREALLAAVRAGEVDAAWRDEIENRVLARSRDRWARAINAAASVEELLASTLLRDRFGADASAVEPRVRRNLKLLELSEKIGWIDRANRDAADEQAKRIVQTWLDEVEQMGLMNDAGDEAWRSGLRSALADQARGSGEFDPARAGPGAKGWAFVAEKSDNADGEFARLTYRFGDAASDEQVFHRVPPANETDELVWYLADREAPIAFMLAVVPRREEGEWRFLRGTPPVTAPRGWKPVDGRQGKVAGLSEAWVDGDPRIDGQPAFAGGPVGRSLADTSLNPSRSSPIQMVDGFDIGVMVELAGCVLPPAEVWLRALRDEASRAGLGQAFEINSWYRAFDANLRDRQWQAQKDHVQQLLNPEFQRTMASNTPGTRDEASRERSWHNEDDGFLLFCPVDREGKGSVSGGRWRHLIGNVAELVVGNDGDPAVIGASALTPPEVDPLTPYRVETRRRLEQSSDVGFRLAFSVPTEQLRSTVVQRVTQIVAQSPYVWP